MGNCEDLFSRKNQPLYHAFLKTVVYVFLMSRTLEAVLVCNMDRFEDKLRERQSNSLDSAQVGAPTHGQTWMPQGDFPSSLRTISPATFHVLIVDDDPPILRLLERWLTKAGYQVSQAKDAETALQMVCEEPPHIVITDWEMPGMKGPELCCEMRRLKLPHYVYVLIVTSHNESANLITALSQGADDFLAKPIREAELMARLGAAIRILSAQRQLQEMAQKDSLTGLLTQRSFHDFLEKQFEIALRSKRPLSCAMVDLDFFKRINDIHGHQAGDYVLKTTAEVLLRSCRASDIVCRYGGEEFCVLLPDTTEENAVNWAERFRAELKATPFVLGPTTVSLTCSVGISQAYDDTLTPEQLVDQADQALLCAKRAGRDRVVRYYEITFGEEVNLSDKNRQGDLFEGVLASHVMSPIVAPLRGDETVDQAAEFFLRSRISSAPVVDKAGRLIGVISEKDLMSAMTSVQGWCRPISDLMRPQVITYPADTPVRIIYEFLCRVSTRRVIITDDSVPVGAISRSSLLRWFRNLVLSKAGAKENVKSLNNSGDARIATLQEALTAISFEVQRLQQALDENAPDVAANVVGAASRIQELATDMLAFANNARDDAINPAFCATALWD